LSNAARLTRVWAFARLILNRPSRGMRAMARERLPSSTLRFSGARWSVELSRPLRAWRRRCVVLIKRSATAADGAVYPCAKRASVWAWSEPVRCAALFEWRRWAGNSSADGRRNEALRVEIDESFKLVVDLDPRPLRCDWQSRPPAAGHDVPNVVGRWPRLSWSKPPCRTAVAGVSRSVVDCGLPLVNAR